MKKITLYIFILANVLSGCTQIITTPISIAGSAVSATIDVTGAAVGAVAGSSDEEEE